jgi:hypothetical protein
MDETRKWAAELLASSFGPDVTGLISGIERLTACVDVAEMPKPTGRTTRWSRERKTLLMERRQAGDRIAHILPALNALPGPEISWVQANSFASSLGLRSASQTKAAQKARASASKARDAAAARRAM